jgi:hypothetical protein
LFEIQEPKKFIQVIAALSLLSPAKLGFDPTMKLLVSPNVAEFPYQPTEEFVNSYDHAPHNRQWVITMNSGTQYVTVRTVSAIRAEFMRGRGTLVWVVVRFGDKKGKSNEEVCCAVSSTSQTRLTLFQILVLKQSWSPRSVTDEHTLYEAASGSDCDQIGKIDLSEEVKISGQSDTTNMLIRSGLDDSTGLGKRSTTQRPAPESSDRYLQIEDTAWDEIQEINDRSTGPPVSRVRVRVVMSTYGWLIKHFSTPRELVHVLRDAIKGKYFFRLNFVLIMLFRAQTSIYARCFASRHQYGKHPGGMAPGMRGNA